MKDWQGRTYCGPLVRAGVDPEAWTGEPEHPLRDGAVAVCKQCPVRWECLSLGLETEGRNRRQDPRTGVWGGLEEWERTPVRLQRLGFPGHSDRTRSRRSKAA